MVDVSLSEELSLILSLSDCLSLKIYFICQYLPSPWMRLTLSCWKHTKSKLGSLSSGLFALTWVFYSLFFFQVMRLLRVIMGVYLKILHGHEWQQLLDINVCVCWLSEWCKQVQCNVPGGAKEHSWLSHHLRLTIQCHFCLFLFLTSHPHSASNRSCIQWAVLLLSPHTHSFPINLHPHLLAIPYSIP